MKKMILSWLLVFAALFQAQAAGMIQSSGEVAGDARAVQSADTLRDGHYFWVPDSLADDVRMLLKGHSKVVYDERRLDLSERVLHRGDTIPMVLKSRNFGRFDRGLFNFLFIPKGQWHFALTASYGEFSADDLEMFDILSDFDFSGHTFSIRPAIAYFIRNNLSVGLRFSYNSSKAALGTLNLDISDDMGISLSDISYRNESYSAAITLSQYIGIARRGRFGIFNEVALSFSSGNADFTRPFGGVARTTYNTYMKASLDFSPGVCVFIMKNVSFNLSFGVFGFYLRNEKQTVDGIPEGNRFTSGANFRFNIFNINFGIGVHI